MLVVRISQFVSAAHASSPAVVDAVYVGEATPIPRIAHVRFCDVVHRPSLQAQTVVLHVASVCGAPSGGLHVNKSLQVLQSASDKVADPS